MNESDTETPDHKVTVLVVTRYRQALRTKTNKQQFL